MTRLQKFNGENTANNRIVIDYRRRKVDFTPVITKGRWKGMLTFYALIAIVSFYPFAIMSAILMIKEVWYGRIFAYASVAVSALNVLFTWIRMRTSRRFRHDVFPKLNDWLIRVMHFRFKNKTVIFRPQNLHGRMAIVPSFANVMIGWECYGDFSIRKVMIKNFDDRNEYEWYAIFLLDRKPKHGRLEVEYN